MPLALASPLAARPLSAPLRPRRDGLRPRRVSRSRPARDASIVASSSSDAPAPVVVGVGSAGVDYLASVASFPEPDAKLRTDALEIQGGGNCGNALTAVARLGCAPRILTKLSDDAAGRAIVAEFDVSARSRTASGTCFSDFPFAISLSSPPRAIDARRFCAFQLSSRNASDATVSSSSGSE